AVHRRGGLLGVACLEWHVGEEVPVQARQVDWHPLPLAQRASYVAHAEDYVTEQLASRLWQAMTGSEHWHASAATQTDRGLWVGCLERVEACASEMLGVGANAELSCTLPGIGGIMVWSEASWMGV